MCSHRGAPPRTRVVPTRAGCAGPRAADSVGGGGPGWWAKRFWRGWSACPLSTFHPCDWTFFFFRWLYSHLLVSLREWFQDPQRYHNLQTLKPLCPAPYTCIYRFNQPWIMYNWPLNNMGLNCMSSLTCRFSSINPCISKSLQHWKKKIHTYGPAQFKRTLFRGQLLLRVFTTKKNRF